MGIGAALGVAAIGAGATAYSASQQPNGKAKGFSPKRSEAQQRLDARLQELAARNFLTNNSINDQFLLGGDFKQSGFKADGKKFFGSATAPEGPLFNLVNQGLQGEEQLSRLRQQLAQQQLLNTGFELDRSRQFGISNLQGGQDAIYRQRQLQPSITDTFRSNEGLNQQLTGDLGDFFNSGGAPNDFQQQNINSIFDSQRDVGFSNLQAQFGDAVQELQDQATNRGLRFGDTPIQDRGNRLTEEFARNATNLESQIGGAQSQANINVPFQQAQFAGQQQGQQQNQMLNLLNSFSSPITQGQNATGQFFNQQQFGAQFAPSQFSGPALNNVNTLFNGSQLANPNPTFANSGGGAQNPSFGQTFGNSFGQALGSGLGGNFSTGIAGAIAGMGDTSPQQSTVNPATRSVYQSSPVYGPPQFG